MYSNGICMEYSYKRKSCLYCGTGSNKRFNHTDCICANCKVFAWSIKCISTLWNIVFQCDSVCGDSTCWGVLTRIVVVKNKGIGYFENTFVHKFDNATTVGLLLTLVLIFASQTEVILSNPLHIVLIAVPLTVQTVLIFFIAYSASKIFGMSHDIAAPAGMIGASNFFELAVAVAIALFGTTSPAALATTVGVLTEVPVMLALVKVANSTRGWFKK